ncbi:DNA mismatch repair endonuclease MutL [Natronorarus salvus]|uniref:DNA mismatch repair endonuclease MutL n=1 Tax=Natronorarus salvus TaxID=3117733 RepID=UPI002F26B02B
MSDDEPRIRRLDPETVDRIAAGEVVERPASVVKELVENSLDADASRIAVEVDSGGIDRIRVADDGIGMSESEVREAVRQHTTSKIRDISDLEAGVETLGFRGEALHTIGAVSRTRITTRPRGSEGAGTTLTLVGGEVESVEPAGPPEGTAIEVTDLFYNTPARKKFLKTEPTEFDHVNTVVTRYALANPDTSISLEHEGREVFATTGQGDLRTAVLSVYGREVARGMVDVDAEPETESLSAVSGLVSEPEVTRAGSTYLSTYVNGRYVRSKLLREAVLSAYEGQLSPSRYPFAVLFVSVPPESVDVNVHPRKMEVRFDDENGVKRAVERAVEAALRERGSIRRSAPRGRSEPEETAVEPESVENRGGDVGETTGHDGRGDTVESESDRAISSGPGEPDDEGRERSGASDTTEARAGRERSGTGEPRSGETRGGVAPESDERDGSERGVSRTGSEGSDWTLLKGEGDGHRSVGGAENSRFEATTQTTIEGGPVEDREFEQLPSLRVLGQLADTYLVCEAEDGLVLVDQHAADERVNYERLRDQFAETTTTQALVEPVSVELTAREAELFDDYREALSRVGFTASREARDVTVTTVPSVASATLGPDLLRDALSAVLDGDPETTVEATADALLADLACYPSITGNTSLTEGSVVELLAALDACENPYACPHGRPVLVRIDGEEIGDRFERDYPGHADRRSE